MKAFLSYFTPATADGQDENGREGVGHAKRRLGRRQSVWEKAHPLQPMQPRGRAPTSETLTPPLVPPLDRRPQHRGDGTSAKTAARSSSRAPSTGNSLFPTGDHRNGDTDTLSEIRNDMMVNWPYEQQQRKQYALRVCKMRTEGPAGGNCAQGYMYHPGLTT